MPISTKIAYSVGLGDGGGVERYTGGPHELEGDVVGDLRRRAQRNYYR